jgi:hypothetical protein
MPQGLPKKIEVGLLLPDLALELGNPTPRRFPIVEQRTAQWRPIQRTAPRTAWAAQRLQPTAPSHLLPLVYPAPVDPQIGRHPRHRLAGRHPTHGSPA